MAHALGVRPGQTLAAFVVAAVLSCAPAASAQPQDAFVRRRLADVAAMREFDPVSLSFTTGRSTYRIGETIPLSLVFEQVGLLPLTRDDGSGLGLVVVLDHNDGTASPYRDRHDYSGLLGGISGNYYRRSTGGVSPFGWLFQGPPPEYEVAYLNDAVRFDRPGTYRFYLRSYITSPVAGDATPPRISNILELQIAPRDPVWEQRTVAAAMAALNTSPDAERTLVFLGTHAAVDALLPLYEKVARYVGQGLPHAGLFSARDRRYVVRRLTARLLDPAATIPRGFVNTLAVLDLTRHANGRRPTRADYDAKVREYCVRRYRALARAGRLSDELRSAFDGFRPGGNKFDGAFSSLAPAFPAFPHEVETALRALPPATQRTLLTEDGWNTFRDSSFVPMWRRLAASRDSDGPQDVALAMLFLHQPAEARAIALREVASPTSLIGVAGLRALGDEPLPQLDEALASRLEAARDHATFSRVIGLVERFATAAIAPRVEAVMDRTSFSPPCPQYELALGYLLRVDPAAAEPHVDGVADAYAADDNCASRGGLLSRIAAHRYTPTLERIAMDRVRDPSRNDVSSAAAVLSTYGSAGAEAALWDGFSLWSRSWTGRGHLLDGWQPRTDETANAINLEAAYSSALLEGAGWRGDESLRMRVQSLCQSARCRARAAEAAASVISIRAMPDPVGPQSYLVVKSIGSHTGTVSTHRLDQLEAYPPGTRWGWMAPSVDDAPGSRDAFDQQVQWLPGREAAAFDTFRRFAEARGMHVVREGTK